MCQEAHFRTDDPSDNRNDPNDVDFSAVEDNFQPRCAGSGDDDDDSQLQQQKQNRQEKKDTQSHAKSNDDVASPGGAGGDLELQKQAEELELQKQAEEEQHFLRAQIDELRRLRDLVDTEEGSLFEDDGGNDDDDFFDLDGSDDSGNDSDTTQTTDMSGPSHPTTPRVSNLVVATTRKIAAIAALLSLDGRAAVFAHFCAAQSLLQLRLSSRGAGELARKCILWRTQHVRQIQLPVQVHFLPNNNNNSSVEDRSVRHERSARGRSVQTKLQ